MLCVCCSYQLAPTLNLAVQPQCHREPGQQHPPSSASLTLALLFRATSFSQSSSMTIASPNRAAGGRRRRRRRRALAGALAPGRFRQGALRIRLSDLALFVKSCRKLAPSALLRHCSRSSSSASRTWRKSCEEQALHLRRVSFSDEADVNVND